MQVFIPSPYDPSEADRAALVQAATPYIRCINAHLPEAYFDWPRQPVGDEERRERVDATVATFGACERERNAIDARTTSGSPIDRHRVGMFFSRLEDSYTYPVMLGMEPNLLIDPRRAPDASH